MKKTSLFLMALGFITLVSSCEKEKDEDSNTPAATNEYIHDGNSELITNVSYTDIGVFEGFSNNQTKTYHKFRDVSLLTSNRTGIVIHLGSIDTNAISTGVYTYANNDETNPAIIQGNIVAEGNATVHYDGDPNPYTRDLIGGTATVNSISDTDINISFEFVLASKDTLRGNYGGVMTKK